jgi:hypothetical protein
MHRSDKLAFGIIGGGALLIGGSYLLFRLFGDSRLIALLTIAGWFLILALILKYYVNLKNKIWGQA